MLFPLEVSRCPVSYRDSILPLPVNQEPMNGKAVVMRVLKKGYSWLAKIPSVAKATFWRQGHG